MQRRLNTSGFTIVELMISTAVFSLILMVLLASIMAINNTYTKGMISAQTQNVARNVLNNIAQAIQLTPGSIIPIPPAPDPHGPANVLGFCVGTQQFSYALGQKLDASSPGSGGLLQDSSATACRAGNTPSMSSGSQQLANNMRIASLSITQPDAANNPNLYTVDVQVVYGDDDLLCSTTVSGSCNSSTDLTPPQLVNGTDLRCKASVGKQYCAMAAASTTVERRIQ